MRSLILWIEIGLAVVGFAASTVAAPVIYRLPPENLALKPGFGLDQVISNCGTCHSLDYISTQPPQRGETFWQAEVAKMGAVYGAQIPADAGKDIVAYLAANY